MKKRWLVVLFIISIIAVAGCGKKSATDHLKTGFTKMATADSYEFEGTLGVKFDAKEMEKSNPEMALASQMLNGFEIKYHGSYNKKTKQQMVTLDVSLKGDMSINLQIPFILDDKNMYIKVPQIPFVPIPKDVVGKYVHLTPEDLKEFDENAPNSFNLDPAKQEDLLKQVGQVLEKHYKDDKYLTVVDEGKPDGVANLVQYNVNNENLQEEATKLAKNVLPEVLQILAKPEFKDATGITEENVKEYNDSLKDFDKGFTEFQKTGKLNEAKSLIGTNKGGFLNYFKQTIDLSVDDAKTKTKFNVAVTSETRMSKFNDSSVQVTIPDKSQTVTVKQLQDSFASSFDY
ncbi:hypothetical protein J31TS4_25270 [Paenibacillus sp. J31TS4]|uniref:hypothetical protein n=1 Tax=Paenibacillus sp. J31TS4 TaxID=2807195 RepID=UPI001B11074D|nr:hypothetical protein [Paenibacillus sp. J31TS4]GIP39247.1 hypothetical protein J31TS4_25270 [Paenibacillus sp. J31TS4]